MAHKLRSHLHAISKDIACYQISLDDAREHIETIDAIFENALDVLKAVDANETPLAWIQADENLMVWVYEHVEATLNVMRYEALIDMLKKRHTAVFALVSNT